MINGELYDHVMLAFFNGIRIVTCGDLDLFLYCPTTENQMNDDRSVQMVHLPPSRCLVRQLSSIFPQCFHQIR